MIISPWPQLEEHDHVIIIFSVQKEKIHSALSMAEERTGEKKISQ